MIIVLKKGTEQREIDTLTDMIVSQGITVNPIVGSDLTILGLIGDTSKVDDTQIEGLSNDIARQIQDEMTYPGQVKITVIRETRSVSYAK